MDFDTNGDGVIDQVASDTNGDGVIDEWQLDTDADGIVDQAAFDTDGDGCPDMIVVDPNQDGVVDSWQYDTDGDGYYDEFVTNAPAADVLAPGDPEFSLPALDRDLWDVQHPGQIVPEVPVAPGGPFQSIVFDPHAPTSLAAPTTGLA